MVASRGSGIGYPAGGSALTQGHRFPVSTHLWRCHCRLPVRGLAPSPAGLDSSTGDTGEAAENLGHAVHRRLPPAPRPRARADPSGKKRTMTCLVDLFIQARDEGRVPEAATPTSPRCCSPPGWWASPPSSTACDGGGSPAGPTAGRRPPPPGRGDSSRGGGSPDPGTWGTTTQPQLARSLHAAGVQVGQSPEMHLVP
jgi:hypothetical protein